MASIVIPIPSNCLPCCSAVHECPDITKTLKLVISGLAACPCLASTTSAKITAFSLSGAFTLTYDAMVGGWVANSVGSITWTVYSDAVCSVVDSTVTGTFNIVVGCAGAGVLSIFITSDDTTPSQLNAFTGTGSFSSPISNDNDCADEVPFTAFFMTGGTITVTVNP